MQTGYEHWGLPQVLIQTAPPPASLEVEGFLKDVERSLLGSVKPGPATLSGRKQKSNGDINRMINRLADNPTTVVVPTDKTSAYRVVKTINYQRWVTTIIDSDTVEVS